MQYQQKCYLNRSGDVATKSWAAYNKAAAGADHRCNFLFGADFRVYGFTSNSSFCDTSTMIIKTTTKFLSHNPKFLYYLLLS